MSLFISNLLFSANFWSKNGGSDRFFPQNPHSFASFFSAQIFFPFSFQTPPSLHYAFFWRLPSRLVKRRYLHVKARKLPAISHTCLPDFLLFIDIILDFIRPAQRIQITLFLRAVFPTAPIFQQTP
jgi:hypothetical protein